ncbi:hypothetical protein MH117_03755 [Paenibacillus sp. ACRRX]|uniref:hypothetical protein n=1 Tax=Paenibacillus sp. ACRRX TaxID=2918206 RepID=UPI001EF689D8|nr:hypothetical protein [Paenibacillus sp. ACRRX]MCG7406520.1 hypothetical protein [Paenibacillus sp. ACRRX]
MAIIIVSLNGCGKPLPPTIKHGEFPFHLKYELNGKVYDINDIVVCDFREISSNSGLGYIRKWDDFLKSGTNRISILSDENVHSVLKPNRVNSRVEVFYNYGLARYFMGDPDGSFSEKPQIKYIEEYSIKPNETHFDSTPLTEEQLEKYFGIKIIEWNYSKPIKNTFK